MGLAENESLLSGGTSHRRRSGWVREGLSLLKWSMLAACTVGPGTVVVCAKAGADFDLQLLWTVLIAAVIAFVLQKEAARLTMESGMSLGAAVRRHFASRASTSDTHPTASGSRAEKLPKEFSETGDPNTRMCEAEKVPIAGYATVLGVFVGNTAYEANCFVGAMAALYVLYTNVVWFRVLMAMITGVATLAALLWGDVDQIGAALGVIVLAMMVIFAVTAGYVNVPAREFGLGLIPNFPSGSSITVLSLVATTCLPFNVFLAASLCGDASGGEMRRGIGFASTITAIISVLLVLIGSDITIPLDADFAVEDLGNQIGDNLGFEAKVLFCIGLYAAAYSSAITCPLGAALTAEQILYDDRTSLSSGTTASRETEYSVLDAKPAAAGVLTAPLSWSWLQKWQRGGLFFRGSLFISVGVSIVISSANIDTVSVILFAQVVNGLLLPFVATSLFLCLNDPAIMPRPVLVRDNVLMLVCVGITIFLASYLVLDQISLLVAGRLETEDINEDGEGAWSTELNIYVALAVGFIGAVILALRRYGWRRQTVDG